MMACGRRYFQRYFLERNNCISIINSHYNSSQMGQWTKRDNFDRVMAWSWMNCLENTHTYAHSATQCNGKCSIKGLIKWCWECTDQCVLVTPVLVFLGGDWHWYWLEWVTGCIYVLSKSTDNVDGLVQERRNSSALAMESRLSCTNPSICSWSYSGWGRWPLWCVEKPIKITWSAHNTAGCTFSHYCHSAKLCLRGNDNALRLKCILIIWRPQAWVTLECCTWPRFVIESSEIIPLAAVWNGCFFRLYFF